MKVEFIANASFLITLDSGATILTDPWFADGIYYGSWYNFPPVPDAVRARVLATKLSLVYVSHLHPDHLDVATLAQLPRSTPIAIGKLPHDHLRRQILQLGFTDVRELPLGELVALDDTGGHLAILAAFGSTGDGLVDEVGYAMDTSLVVRDRDGTQLLHGVDNPIRVSDASDLRTRFGRFDVAILPYGGASFYPHAARAFTDDHKTAAAAAVGTRRLDHFVQLATALDARWSVPAAGSYVMGGRIAPYSRYLHQATPAEIQAAWTAAGRESRGLCVMMPADTIDTASRTVTRADSPFRTFTSEQRADYAMTLADRALPQDEIRIPQAFRVPWPRLLAKARKNLWSMQTRLGITPSLDIELHVAAVPGMPSTSPIVFAFALDAEAPYARPRPPDRPHVAFHIDASLLLMVLVGAANWNNVEIAALVEFERTPERYEPTVHSLMSFFTL